MTDEAAIAAFGPSALAVQVFAATLNTSSMFNYQKNPIRYKFYRYRCGRDQRLEELWGESAGK